MLSVYGQVLKTHVMSQLTHDAPGSWVVVCRHGLGAQGRHWELLTLAHIAGVGSRWVQRSLGPMKRLLLSGFRCIEPG